jgi:predicted ribosomally synthesized peptide with SipW-like signal peptide
MKAILISLMVIALVGGLVGSGLFAHFTDVEQSTGNTFTAGHIDLEVDVGKDTSGDPLYYNGQPFPMFGDLGGLQPCHGGEVTVSLHLTDGSCPADATMNFTKTLDAENDIVDPETKLSDTGPDGELDNFLWLFIWVDDGDNIYETDEAILYDGYAVNLPATIAYPGTLVACTPVYVGFQYHFDQFNGSYAQGQHNNTPPGGNESGSANVNIAMTDSWGFSMSVDVAQHIAP